MKRSVFIVIALLIAVIAYGDCDLTIPSGCLVTNVYYNQSSIGQSFTPTCSAELRAVKITNGLGNNYSETVTLYLLSGQTVDTSSPVATVSGYTLASSGTLLTIPLNSPYPSLSSGSLYTVLIVDDSGNDLASWANGGSGGLCPDGPYADGKAYRGGSFEDAFDHETWEFTITTPLPPSAVPLSPFAIIAALSLIGFVGLWAAGVKN